MPFTSLLSKKKAVNITIEKPRFALNGGLLEMNSDKVDFASGFTVKHIDLRHGEIQFQDKGITLRLLDFDVQSGPTIDGSVFKITSPHLKIIFPLNGQVASLEGNLKGEFRRQGNFWKINQLLWETRNLHFNFNGRILADGSIYINASSQGDPQEILRPVLGEFAPTGLTNITAKIVKNVNNIIQIKADFTSLRCSIGEIFGSNITGNLSWNNISSNLAVEIVFDTPLTRSHVQVFNKNWETDLVIHDIPAAYLASVLSISQDAPLAGIVRKAKIKINSALIDGLAELDATASQPLTQPFVAKGTIQFKRDKKKKLTVFSGRDLQFSGGQVSLSGQIDSLKKSVDVNINATMKNFENIAAYSAYYLKLDLLPWKLSRGNGMFSLEMNVTRGRKRGKSLFALENFFANRQSIASLRGDVRISPDRIQSDAILSAPDLRSLVNVDMDPHLTTINFKDVHGEAGKILKILGNNLALSGKIAGAFTYQSSPPPQRPLLQGKFQSPQLRFFGYPLDQASGSLRSDMGNIELSQLRFGFKGGSARVEAAIDFRQRRFDIDGRIEHIDIASIHGKLGGRAEIQVAGRGEFLRDPLEISCRLDQFSLYPDRIFSASAKASVWTDFSDFSASGSGELRNPAGSSPFTAEISRRNSSISGQYKLDLKDINMLLPWKNNTGSMRLIGQISAGEQGRIVSRGVAIFSGPTLSIPSFSHSLDNFQATLTFDGAKFNLQSLSGEMGGGKVDANGQLALERNQVQSLIVNFQGKNMFLYPLDRVSCRANADLTLKYLSKKLLISGDVGFLSANWQREIDEPFVFNTPANLATAESKIREMLQLDISMNGENIQIDNSLGRIKGQMKLKLTGTASFPVLLGTFDSNQGEIHFSDRSFNLLKAKLVFNNSLFIDPLITIESETFIQNYRIRFDIKGPASSAKPELISSPPLPPQEILALVSLGEAFTRTGSQEMSSQLGSTALITTELAKEIKNRANRLLGINMLRLEPVLNSQSALDTSRLTIGTSIIKNLIVVYSTNLSTTRQEIYYLQYQLSPTVSLIYMKNEEGRYSLDLRLRKRR